MNRGRPKILIMVVDTKNNDMPLFVGDIHEVSEFVGTTPENIHSSLSHAKKKGFHSKYVHLGLLDED